MQIRFLGAAREVTGSCYVVDTGRVRFAVDCGMHQGGREAGPKNRAERVSEATADRRAPTRFWSVDRRLISELTETFKGTGSSGPAGYSQYCGV